jgi:hypothetical protein
MDETQATMISMKKPEVAREVARLRLKWQKMQNIPYEI